MLDVTFPTLPNPKDIDLKFEKRIAKGVFREIAQPAFNMRVFNHNFQKGMI